MGHKTQYKPKHKTTYMHTNAPIKLPLTEVAHDWDDEKDAAEFNDRFGDDEGDVYERGLGEIEHGLFSLDESLGELLTVLLNPKTDLEHRAIKGITIPGKIELSHQAPKVKTCPASSLQRLEEDLARCTAAYRVSDHVLGQFVLARGDVWLVEIADAADAMVTAGFLLKESINCEYARLASPVDSSMGALAQVAS